MIAAAVPHAPTLDLAATAAALSAAVRALAGVCDGAASQDDAGFSGQDVKFGHRLAHLPPALWTPAIARVAWEMLFKYRRQLQRFGIDYPSLPIPPAELPPETILEARQHARRLYQAHAAGVVEPEGEERLLDLDDEAGEFVLRFPYHAGLVAEVKAGVPGRRWDGGMRAWRIPAVPASADQLRDFARAWSFDASPEALARLDWLCNNPLVALLRRAPQRCILMDGADFLVRFPTHPELEGEVQAIEGAKWHPQSRTWKVPGETALAVSRLRELARVGNLMLGPGVPEVMERVGREARARVAASAALDADIEVPGLGKTLHPFQRAGVAYAVEAAAGVLIADEQGLGKSPQSLAVVQARDEFPLVIACKSNLKRKWERECRMWLPGRRVMVLDGMEAAPALLYQMADIYIINFDLLLAEKKRQPGKKPGETVEVWEPRGHLVELIRIVRSLVVDESHLVKNPQARRTQACILLGQAARTRVLLSGTPIPNRTEELIPQLEIMDRLKDFGGAAKFKRRYCQRGAQGRIQLNKALRATCYIRRRKSEVLPELPPVQTELLPLPLSNRAEYDRAERDLVGWLRDRVLNDAAFLDSIAHLPAAEQEREKRVRIADVCSRAMAAETLVMINALRRLSARGKMEAALDWIREFLTSGEKLVIFCHHRDVAEELGRELGFDVVYGGVSAVDAQRMVDRFQEDPAVLGIVMNLTSGAEGHNLTAASNIVLLEFGWTPKDHDQAIARTYGRLNDVHGTNATFLAGERTIDLAMYELVEAKREETGQVIDGKAGTGSETSTLRGVVERLLGA